jgi:site-specific recombinase XerC
MALNFRENARKSSCSCYAPLFGTRGSQVQILPLRPSNLTFDSHRHPHVLRHAWGHAPGDKGHDTRTLQAYLWHRDIQRTVRYTELFAPTRFSDFQSWLV